MAEDKMSDLLAMQIMASNNLNIRMSPYLVSAQSVKQGGHVTMGIDGETLLDLVMHPEDFVVGLYVADAKQFNAIKEKTTEKDYLLTALKNLKNICTNTDLDDTPEYEKALIAIGIAENEL